MPNRRRDRIEPPAPAPAPRPPPTPAPPTGPEDPKPVDPTPADPPPAPAPEGDTSIAEVDPPEELGNLKFLKLDMLRNSNRWKHKTTKYETKILVLRRGWGFKVKVILSETYSKDTDLIILKFLKSSTPEFSKKTCVLLRSDQSEKSFMNQGWTLDVDKTEDKEVTLEVTPDVDALVGRWSVVVETQRKKSEDNIQVSRKTAAEVILLFNAYHKDDDVYMEEAKNRTEHLEDETGTIYTNVGPWTEGKRRWLFGQYEENILDAALWILDNGYLKKHLFGNAVHVTRALSAEVNDEVLIGNWSGDYSDGTSPTKWNGSVKILQQFYNSKSAVQYGQCWVFSGVLTTVTRALGICCRPVTNNSSAHDQDGSNTIDHYVDKDGEPIEYRNRDSVWNFHVWNEAWMRRQDLPSGYDGWQAFDSTPQEASDGRYRCGPCPVKAIYKGQVDIMYDAPFIFSEVNADRVYWKIVDGNSSVYSIKTEAVGKYISTKAVGENKREDVTDKYKAAEGSKEERTNAMNAIRRGTTWNKMMKEFDDYMKHTPDVVFAMEPRINTSHDYACEADVKITNNSDKERTITGTMNMLASYNVGPAREKIHAPYHLNVTVAAGQSETVEWHVPAEDYFSKLNDDAMVQICAALSVKDTDYTWSCVDNVPIDKPDMELSLKGLKEPAEVEIGEEFTVAVSFTNPLNITIHDVDVDLEGPGIDKEMDLNVKKELGPKETLTASVKLKAKRPGQKAIIASFDGKELQGISGAVTIKVKGEEVIED